MRAATPNGTICASSLSGIVANSSIVICCACNAGSNSTNRNCFSSNDNANLTRKRFQFFERDKIKSKTGLLEVAFDAKQHRRIDQRRDDRAKQASLSPLSAQQQATILRVHWTASRDRCPTPNDCERTRSSHPTSVRLRRICTYLCTSIDLDRLAVSPVDRSVTLAIWSMDLEPIWY